MEKMVCENSTQDKTKNLEAKLKKVGKCTIMIVINTLWSKWGVFSIMVCRASTDTFVDINKYMIETVQVIEQNRQGSKTPASIKLIVVWYW